MQTLELESAIINKHVNELTVNKEKHHVLQQSLQDPPHLATQLVHFQEQKYGKWKPNFYRE